MGATDATNLIIKVNGGNGVYTAGNTIIDGTNHAIQVQTPTNGGSMVTINPNSKNLGNSSVFSVNGVGTGMYISSNGSGTFTGNLSVGQIFTCGTLQNSSSTVFRLTNSTTLAKFDYTNQSVQIGTTTDVPSSILTTSSTTKGSIPFPKMTTSQRTSISSPTSGLGVYDTDLNSHFVYNGSAWVMKPNEGSSPTWTGTHIFRKDGIGTTPTETVRLENTTAATSGNPQNSPALSFVGKWYNTTASTSNTSNIRIFNRHIVTGKQIGRAHV